jgi:hypothetical protein
LARVVRELPGGAAFAQAEALNHRERLHVFDFCAKLDQPGIHRLGEFQLRFQPDGELAFGLGGEALLIVCLTDECGKLIVP